MPAVLIYNQKNLEYIVLPNRRIFSKDKDLVRPIANADNHILWTDPENRKRIQDEGTRFFKRHEDYLGSPPSMDDVDGKMSQGFFVYLTFLRFQNQAYHASIVRNSDINKLTKEENHVPDTNLAKLLTLQTALEHLAKAGEREYLEPGEEPPEGVKEQKGTRGGRFYDPSQVSQQDDVPREIDVIQAPALDDDDDDDDEGQGIIGGKIDANTFIANMKEQGFRPLSDLIDTLPRITVDAKKELVRQAALEGKGPQTDAVPITPNTAVVNDEGKVVQITTADGQLQAVQEFDPENPERGGKLHLFFSTDKDAKIQVAWMDNLDRPHAGYSAEYNKGQAIKKFEKIKKLAKSIPQIEKQCKVDITNNSRFKEAALAVALIHNTYRRIGSGRSKVTWDGEEGRPGPKKDKDGKFIRDFVATFGVTSFQAQHIVVKGKKVYLNFLGKSGKLNDVEVTNPLVKNELIARKRAAGKDKTAVIMNVKPPAVNAYLKQASGGDFSVKNFRTYHGTRLAADLVSKTKIPRLDRKKFDAFMKRRVNKGVITNVQDWKEEAFLWALKERNKLKIDIIGEPISDQLSNTKQVCIAQYIDTMVFQDWDISLGADTEKLLRSRFAAADVKVAQKKLKEKAKNPPKSKGKPAKRKKK